MRSFSRCGAVAILLAMAAACNQRTKTQQLAALDEAYQSGVFTKQEYDAKRAAILGPAQPAPAAAPVPVPAPAVAPVPVPAPAAPAPVRPANPPPQPIGDRGPREAASSPSEASSAPPSPPASLPSPICADAESAPRKDEGPQSRFFALPVERVKQAAEAALATLDFTIHQDNGNQIEASKNRHIGVLVGAGGERETLQFEPATENGQSGTRVTGATKKSFMGRLAQKSWTAAVLAQTACNLR